MTDAAVIYVPGIGHIGQYDSWLSMLQSGDMGILYFFRDYYFTEIQALQESSENRQRIRNLICRLNHLNKVLSEHEKVNGFPYVPAQPAPSVGRRK